jgi:hypothetical protein
VRSEEMEEHGRVGGVELPEGLLEGVIAEVDREEVVGAILGGSYARGIATALSDVDVALFVQERGQVRPRRYFYRQGLLVSVTTKCLDGVRADLERPAMAIRVVPGLSEARVLVDKDGSVAALLDEVARFEWEPMREKANRHVSDLMNGLTENVQKLANEVTKGNTPGVSYILDKVLDALTEALVVYRGLMIRSDSTYYAQAQEAAGDDSEWAAYHRRAAGLTGASLDERARACLYLHLLTREAVRPAMDPDYAKVVEEAARRVAFLYPRK